MVSEWAIAEMRTQSPKGRKLWQAGTVLRPHLAISIALALLVLSWLIVSIPDAAAAPKDAATPHSQAVSAAAKPPRGVALVIGSGALGDKLVLPSASVRACLLTGKLRSLGFDVTEVQNAERRALSSSIQAFRKKAKDADIALAYYAGFTVAYRGNNRFVPADVDLVTSKKMRKTTVVLSGLFKALSSARRYGLLFLDGGYQHSSLKRLQRRNQSRVSKGLARLSKRKKLAMLLGDSPGRWRSSNKAQITRLAEALTHRLSHPSASVADLLASIVTDVRTASGEKQTPMLITSLPKASVWPFGGTDTKEKDGGDGIIFRWEANDNGERAMRKCRKLAEIRLAQRKTARACKRALAKKSLKSYRELLKTYPQAKCASEVVRLRDSILEARRWKRIAKGGTRKDFEIYLKRFPDGAHKDKAKNRLAVLIEEERRREKDAFRMATARNPVFVRIIELKRFLDEYPDGNNAEKARQMITWLKKEEREKEKRDWKLTKHVNTIDAYQKFLLEYPESANRKRALRRLAELEKEKERQTAKNTCWRTYGANFSRLLHWEKSGYVCKLKGERARFIPVAADKVDAWYFVKKKNGRCEVWTYPTSISGTIKVDREPKVEFWRSADSSGDSLGFAITRANIWNQSKDISIEIDGKTYRLQFSGSFVKPGKTGTTSVSDEVTQALRKADSFTVRGTALKGRHLELYFSARGFETQFRDMARKCGRGITSWIENWGAVTRSVSGRSFQWGSRYNSKSEAKEKILKYCRSRGSGECRIVETFESGCFALYKGIESGWAIATADTVGAAKNKAKMNCQARHEGCYLSATECSNGSNSYNNKNPPRPSLTWRMKSNDPNSVLVEFYSRDRNAAWPGSGKAYVIKDWKMHKYSLSCRWGENICYGAWPNGTSGSRYWGCGKGCRRGCSKSCYKCKGHTTSVTLGP